MDRGNSQIEELFSEAWQKVATGDSVETVLADYPAHADELGPMLRMAAAMRAAPQPQMSEDGLARIHERAQLASRGYVSEHRVVPVGKGGSQGMATEGPRRQSWLASLFPARFSLRTVMAVLVVVLVLGVLVRFGLATNQPNPRQPLETYSGVITKMTPTGWFVGDTEVIVEVTTEIHGRPAVGASMICIGQSLPGDKMRALEVWIDGAPGAPTVLPSDSDDEGAVPMLVWGILLWA